MLIRIFFAALLSFVLYSCKTSDNPATPMDLSRGAIIPRPVLLSAAGSSFELNSKTSIVVEGGSGELMRIANYLAEKLRPATGFALEVDDTKGEPDDDNFIYISASGSDTILGEEGYDLRITEDGISLKADQPAGVFRGIQTIRQLLPDSIELATKVDREWRIPTGFIRDYPAYPFRGSMLDVSRHFFGVEDVKRYIDLIAFYKMNILHLHLADDQGWRIEIKSWPNLATHGGSTQVGGGKGGYYTQEQFRDIVQYAADRYIIIIPEIDMPGHTNAALASYPELNCNDKSPALYTGTKVGFSTLCVRKEITYKFIDDVVRELASLSPGPYIHLGGDESHVTKKDDYIFFVNKVQEIVKKHDKWMIGWEEISQATLDPSTVVQFWSNPEHAKVAVQKGAKIIMSPAKKVYLDMKYDSTTRIGLDWAARIEIDSSYAWNLSSYVQGIPRESILGVEAPLWSETVVTMDDIEFLVFPRLPGIAELGWTPEGLRNWEEYRSRIGTHGMRMKLMGIDFYRSGKVNWGSF